MCSSGLQSVGSKVTLVPLNGGKVPPNQSPQQTLDAIAAEPRPQVSHGKSLK